MRYTYISAHRARGISHPVGEADQILFHDDAKGMRVLLTSNANPQLHVLNRHLALLSLMLRARVGSPLAADFSEQLASEIAQVEDQRRNAFGSDPVVLVEISGDVEAQVPANAREILDFVLCFDAFDKKALHASLNSQVSAVIVALRLSTERQLTFHQVCDGSYLVADDEKIIHSASFEGGNAGLYVSRRLSEQHWERVAADIPLVLNAGGLERVMRLHAQSLSEAGDNYRAFLAAWSALEILIAKLFPTYQRMLAADLRGVNSSPGLHVYLDRISSVMGDKYGLADKFAVLSVYLDDLRAEDEIALFRNLKGVRDRLSHGEEIDEATLPTQDVQRLLDKYLRNHLRRNA